MEFEIIDDEDGFRALEAEWRALCELVPDHRLYQGFDWNWHCWADRWRTAGRSLCILVGRQDGKTAIILPLVLQDRMPVRTARSVCGLICHYDEVLVAAGLDAQCLIARALDHVVSARRIDLLHFRRVRHDSGLYAALVGDRRANRTDLAAAMVDCREWDDWDAYSQTRSAKMRQELRRQPRRLERIGTLEMVIARDRDEIDKTLCWLVEQKKDWLSRTGLARAAFDAERPILQAMSRCAAKDGSLFLARLDVGGTTIAAEMGIIANGRNTALILTHDPAWRKFSPGKLLTQRVLRWTFESGLDEYDFNNDAYAYKDKWATTRVPMTDFLCPRSTLGSAIVSWQRSTMRDGARSAYRIFPSGFRAGIRDALTR